ncbi:MAG: hypothetical protein WCV90_00885 [Candidatus Woesearchaeota archaeon]|jgi:hypothetical protein
MERYNLIILEGDAPGINIIRTPVYQGLVDFNPGLIHENCGDFYSEVSLEGLADAVYRSLDQEVLGEKMNADVVIVDSATFTSASFSVDPDKDYLIKESAGVRIYSPSLHQPDAKHVAREAYALYALGAVEGLLSETKKGSLQVSLDDLGERLRTLTEKLR